MHTYSNTMRAAQQYQENIKSCDNPGGTIMNSYLKMASLLLLQLVIEGVCGVCGDLCERRIPLFSSNSPTVGWVSCLAFKQSIMAENFIQALALQLKIQHTCPLTPMNIEGKQNTITDMPSRSFSSNPAWACNTNLELLTLFNSHFPLPLKQSWTVYCPNCTVVTHMISALQMMPFELDNWRRLPQKGRYVGKIDAPTSNLWGWIHTYNRCPTTHASGVSQHFLSKHGLDSMAWDNGCKVTQSLVLSRPLARQLLWPAMTTQQRRQVPTNFYL
jgi:hypothetical protein